MREQGVKLNRAQAIETMRVGRLSVKMLYTPTAYLESFEGQVLGQLDDIRLRVLWETGAMMLHGRELGDPHSGPGGYPQAWWCELD